MPAQSPMARSFAFWSRRLHRWGAAAATLPLLIVVPTGVVLQLKKDVAWVQPPTVRGSDQPPTLAFDRVLELVSEVPEAQVTSWADVDRLDVRPSKGMLKVRCVNRWEVQLDTTSGEVLHVAYRRSDWIEDLHDGSFIHDLAKLWVFLPAGTILFLLLLTGIYLFALPIRMRRRNARRHGR